MKTPPATFLRAAIATCATVVCCAGRSTPPKLSAERLAALGVVQGATYWDAQQKLAREDYACYVSGAKREHFDCTKTQGVFPTCLLRVDFDVDDKNLISAPAVPNPACMGTP
jgi:hypothetical protein